MSGPIVFALRILLAAALYAFLAWALFTLWQELKQHGSLLGARKTPPVTLSNLPDDGEANSRRFHQPGITIGRNPACDYVINEDSISSRHARLNYHHGHWWLEDLGSKNGTYLNDEPLLTPTVVISGDKIRCGGTNLVLSISGETQTAGSQE
jgi:pSer/pThr/pTyr-binding forkhead associated (FHA) protein